MAVGRAISLLWALLQLHLLTTLALPTTTPSSIDPKVYDVGIVGGGPAGLAAAMSLGRVRRSAILIDSAVYRNGPTKHMHDVPGNDGTVPSAFRALARKEISAYPTITLTNGTVTTITPLNSSSSSSNSSAPPPLFQINLDTTYQTRRIILATGMKDILPPPSSAPGLLPLWGQGVYWCTWCDGWEHRDRPLGLLAPFSAGAINGTLNIWLTLNDRGSKSGVVLLTNGTASKEKREEVDKQLGPGWEGRLKTAGGNLLESGAAGVDDRVIKSFERLPLSNSSSLLPPPTGSSGHDDDDNEGDILLTFTDHTTTMTLNAIKASFPAALASPHLPSQLSLRVGGEEGEEKKVQVDAHMLSSNPGVYAVGDMNSDGSSNVVHALWSAKGAVVGLHGELGREDAEAYFRVRGVRRRRRRDVKGGEDGEEGWDVEFLDGWKEKRRRDEGKKRRDEVHYNVATD